VHKAFQQIRATGRLELFRSHRPEFADGCQQRDFLYVKDAVNMTIHLAERPRAAGLFNLGSGEAHTWIDLANAIFAALERQPDIRFIDMPEHLQPKYQYRTRACIARLRSAGYDAPITPLDAAVSDYVRNYLVPDLRLGDETPGVSI
jgi:ADP-L-glycero-D-manno-heptose 6-epimerase